ncbi:hypothetical protein O3G_MSEX000173 [Manduca sexta]|nr:hypothetical protein O3G_MSEX000173 [Manduca sexta]KAG6438722.1 hypothetical protein O3G_MSEX000173 [Manduca sexta]KAG6438723.1 hypothetical protein O3G_MSEX000173 [Manduca sexta]KAG6438724.1 hypothetical protein O3G_MSEX000173 [Manduca sexta]KAG6438725.1 hypothetical protein O3G_MSEX000173 [Manduca sexta]
MSTASKMLFNMQVNEGGKKPRGRRFTLNEKILALTLYKPSPKAYRLLSHLCVLPSRRTLQNILKRVDLLPGINDTIFEDLKKKVSQMQDKHKFCSILFDEMSIAPALSYDKTHDKIIGFVDNGSKRELLFSDHVLVFMVRGIVKKYKQPIAYSFCSGTTKTADLKILLKSIIKKVQTTGLKVVATVCDQGATNLAALNQLVDDTKKKYLMKNEEFRGGFFEVDDIKIVPIYDPPHLIEGVRNNLLNKNLKFVKNGKVHMAKWSHIENLFHRSPKFRGIKLVHKLTALHVVPSMIPKMRVKYCTQVFSKTVGVALGCMAESGNVPRESTDTAELLMLFDDLFDSVNASFSIEEGKVYRSAVTRNSPHLKLWNSSLPILKSMKYVIIDKEITVPTLTSWVKTIEGFKVIVEYLWSQEINSLLLRNINQDPLENFFGAIRAHGSNNSMPNAQAFENAFKTLLINNLTSAHSPQANCEKDDSICLNSLKTFILNEAPSNNGEEIRHINEYHLNIQLTNIEEILKSRSRVDVEKCAAIAYCSGWVATKAKKNIFKKCIHCKNNYISESIQDFHKYILKKEYCGKKWLCYPTRALFDFFAHVEHITLQVLKNDANKKNIVQYINLIVSVHIDFNFITCIEHKSNLKKYLMNKSVVFFVMNWCKEISNVLTGKSFYNFIKADIHEMDRIILQAREHYHKRNGRKRKS